jgi:hypothetical protein
VQQNSPGSTPAGHCALHKPAQLAETQAPLQVAPVSHAQWGNWSKPRWMLVQTSAPEQSLWSQHVPQVPLQNVPLGQRCVPARVQAHAPA